MNAPIAIFRPGAHFPPLTAEELTRTVAAYDPALHEAPLVYGHPRHDAPAYGWVSSVAFAENLLRATPRAVNQALRSAVQAERVKKISAAFYRPDAPGNPAPGVWYLRHVGFLGATPPVVKGLPPVEFADTEADYEVVEFAERPWVWRGLASLFRGLREHLISTSDLDTADRLIPEYEIQMLSDEAEEQVRRAEASTPEPVFSEGDDMPPLAPTEAERQAALDAREAVLNARESGLDARASGLDQRDADAARRDAVAFAETLVSEGRLLPRDAEAVAEFLHAVEGMPGEATVTFAEGDATVARPGAPARFFRQFLSRLPVQVDFSERSAPTGGEADPSPAPPVAVPAGFEIDAASAQIHKRAVVFAERHGVDYDTAILRITEGQQ